MRAPQSSELHRPGTPNPVLQQTYSITTHAIIPHISRPSSFIPSASSRLLLHSSKLSITQIPPSLTIGVHASGRSGPLSLSIDYNMQHDHAYVYYLASRDTGINLTMSTCYHTLLHRESNPPHATDVANLTTFTCVYAIVAVYWLGKQNIAAEVLIQVSPVPL